jgi:hypothetical protein
LPNGTVDPAFGGGDGWERFSLPGSSESSIERVLLMPNGRILLGGSFDGGWGASTAVSVSQIMPDGSLDPNFGGGDGVVLLNEVGVFSYGYELIRVRDGRIAVVGQGAGNPQVGMLASGASVPDYGAGNDWATPSVGHFGMCMEQVAAPGVRAWGANSACPVSDAVNTWRDVPLGTVTMADIPLPGLATATFAFGMRVSDSQRSGSYSAPVLMEVVAP